MKFEIKFEPDIDSVMKVVKKAFKTTKEIPIVVWSLLEDELLEFQVMHWDELAQYSVTKETMKRKARAVRSGKKVPVGRDGRKEKPIFVEPQAHFTGFLRDRMTSKASMRGYNTTHFEDSEGTKRGAYYFGVDPDYFYNEYPGRLAKLIQDDDRVAALIGVDDQAAQYLARFLWDRMWERFEKEFKGAF